MIARKPYYCMVARWHPPRPLAPVVVTLLRRSCASASNHPHRPPPPPTTASHRRRKRPQKLRNNDYYRMGEAWDGLFRPGMTAPLRITLKNYSNTTATTTTTTNHHLLDDATIATYRNQLTQLLQNYHTKHEYRREDVRNALRTHSDFVKMSVTLVGTPPARPIAPESDHPPNDDDDSIDHPRQQIPEDNLVVHSIFQNVEVESLLQLRVEIENDMDRYESLKLDRFLDQNDLQDDWHTRQALQQSERELATLKRWTKLLTAVLMKSIYRHVMARRIQPNHVTEELVQVATVHVELPFHYNDQFNPFLGRDRRVYGVYRNPTTPTFVTRDPLIPMRVIVESSSSAETTTLEEDPIVILCVSLQPKIPRSLREIFCAPTAPTSTTSTTRESPRTVATFYSILNVQSQQYSKLKLGEYLIHEAVKMLQAESSSGADDESAHYHNNIIRSVTTAEPTSGTPQPIIDTFVTLSPMPGFHTWLLHEMDLCTDPDYSHDATTTTGPGVIRSHPSLYHTVQFLSRQWACPESEVLPNITEYLSARSERERVKPPPSKSQRKLPIPSIPIDGIETAPQPMTPNSSPQIQAAIRYFLEGMGAHYIVHAKIGDTNGTSTMSTMETTKPTNGVARFHLQNGAQVYRINAFADLSLTGISDSLGVMVNYRYNLLQLRQNQAHYEKNYTIATHDYVKQQLQ